MTRLQIEDTSDRRDLLPARSPSGHSERAPNPRLTAVTGEQEILSEDQFLRSITRERRRSERSKTPILLTLIEGADSYQSDRKANALARVLAALMPTIRETDLLGWYRDKVTAGVIFTELTGEDKNAIVAAILEKISAALRTKLTAQQYSQISISFHFFPDDRNSGDSGRANDFEGYSERTAPVNGKMFILGFHGDVSAMEDKYGPVAPFYPDLRHHAERRKVQHAIKRLIDVAGSSIALVALTPVFLLVALLVKISSKGPIIYRQQRLGQFGQIFNLLKFRSMRVDNDAAIHREFMKNVIAGTHRGNGSGGEKTVYKMTNDPRITPIGKFLRRFSFDELPQFINVLRGDMSLVGPRPPLAYEFEEYQLWHRRRVLEAKPGITGLWQVKGRSRVRFDDMVRLDLQYVRTWSLWLDLWILFKTPGAVFLGNDAF